jgi:flagellar biosynthetic protein FlhB
MAHDDSADRTEEPTVRRREEAREEGQIARSVDLTAAVALLAALLLLKALGPQMVSTMLSLTVALGEAPRVDTAELLPWILRAGRATVEILLPFVALVLLATVAGAAAQSGLVLTWKKLSLKPERLDPVAGFRRVFSSDALSRLAIGLLKVAIVTAIAYFTIVGRIGPLLGTGALDSRSIFHLGSGVLYDLALRVGLALLVLGLIDYLLQRWKLERQLRMTKQEVRDELKKMEGDPLIKQHRRQLQARLALQRVNSAVPQADVVVTNPTEYAVALKYDDKSMTAPRVVAKGKDFLAARIRQVAVQFRVPLLQRPPLARALYAGVEVGQEVPPAFYRAVAEVLAYVYQLSGRAAG